MLSTSYPAHGILTGQFHVKGTRANPELTALFDVSNAAAWTWRFDRARGQLSVRNGEVRIANAEVRLPTQATGPAGLLTGNFLYNTKSRDAPFDVTGAGIPLESIGKIQTSHLPVAGRLNFQLRGQGPPAGTPELHSTLRLIDLKLGNDVVGSFDGKLDSDGHRLTATIDSAMASSRLSGKFDVTLGNDYPVVGEITAEQIATLIHSLPPHYT